jgi:hypothetical protein
VAEIKIISRSLAKLIKDIGGCVSTKDVIAWHKQNGK